MYRLNTEEYLMFEPEIKNDLSDRIVRGKKHNYNKSQPPHDNYH